MLSTLRLVVIAAIIASAFPAAAADKKASGTIKSYECGDNCCLTIKTKAGKEITALCTAAGCAAWND
jgi:uncharacterized low-complexity protein